MRVLSFRVCETGPYDHPSVWGQRHGFSGVPCDLIFDGPGSPLFAHLRELEFSVDQPERVQVGFLEQPWKGFPRNAMFVSENREPLASYLIAISEQPAPPAA